MKQKKSKSAIILGLFFSSTVLLLLCGLIRGILNPADILLEENRYAMRFSFPTVEGYLDGSYQESLDNALGDQVGLATPGKRLYNNSMSSALNWMLEPMIRSGRLAGRYIDVRGYSIFGDYYLMEHAYGADRMPEFLEMLDRFNRIIQNNPTVDFYAYYLERSFDINFETNEKAGFARCFLENLQLPAEKKSLLQIDSFDDYKERFYRTDHHWNYIGIQESYEIILHMLDDEQLPLSPMEMVELEGEYAGWNAVGDMASLREHVTLFRYDFPDMQIWIDRESAEDYGKMTLSKERIPDNIYTTMYGRDCGEVIFDTDQDERENLLVLGNSYDNALLKLLATHYNRTYGIDLRHYERVIGTPFVLEHYVQENDIDKVLFVGDYCFYTQEQFMADAA